MQIVQNIFERLATIEPSDKLVLSVYLDRRPQAEGERPGQRSSDIVLKDRLNEIEKTLLPRGPALDNFRIDAQRVQQYLDEHAQTAAQGIAIFASNRQSLFEAIEVGIPFENLIALEPVPDLFQLARLLDEQETAVTAVVDTNTTRLFVTRRGFLHEVPGPNDDPFGYGKRQAGAINQKRYQRRADNKRREFAKEAAEAIERLVDQENATRVILAGDAVAIPHLHQALSQQIMPLVHEEVLSLDIRVHPTEVMAEIQPILTEIEDEESHSLADQLIEEVQAQRLGVVGLQETQHALEYGQGDTLLLAAEATIDEKDRNTLVRQAATTGADVNIVEGHEALQQLGGVGALLRYTMSWV